MQPHVITIPTSDAAFRRFVLRALAKLESASVADLESRLRRTYPRLAARARDLVGEAPAWYVYRDGGWRDPAGDRWWEDLAVPRVRVSADGWLEEANPTARSLLGLEEDEPRHFTDFVVPGSLDDATALFDIVRATGALEATILVQPTTGDAIAVDVRAAADADDIVAVFRLASDVDAAPWSAPRAEPPPRLTYIPATDVAFRSYADRALARMPEPTAQGLTLRLRRLYPHAWVETGEDQWTVRRERDADARAGVEWWLSKDLPRVRYDALALILEANAAATAFFGRPLVGHHWQEFVTAGSTEEVATMLEILAEAGAAESRFRMPRGDGSLLEFDSYTVVEGDEFSTVFRAVPEPRLEPELDAAGAMEPAVVDEPPVFVPEPMPGT